MQFNLDKGTLIKSKDTFNFRKVSRYRKFECNFENLIDKTRSCILSQKESLEGFFQRKKYMEISFRYIRNLDSRHSHGMYLKLSPTSLFFRLGLLYSMSGEPGCEPLKFFLRAHPLKKYQHFLSRYKHEAWKSQGITENTSILSIECTSYSIKPAIQVVTRWYLPRCIHTE